MNSANPGRIAIFILFVMTAFFGGCQKSDRPNLESPVSLDINLIQSQSMFESSLKSRAVPKGIAFSIDEAIREDAVLRVLLKGGSTPADFLVVWDGLVKESFPMQTSMVIFYQGKSEAFDPEKEVEIRINLKKMLPAAADMSNFYFHLLNGSADRKITLHPDGVTTSN